MKQTNRRGLTCRGLRLKTPDWPKEAGREPEKALWEMFMARSAGKKLVPLAAVPDTLLGSGPLHKHVPQLYKQALEMEAIPDTVLGNGPLQAHTAFTQQLGTQLQTHEVLSDCTFPCHSDDASTHGSSHT